MQEGNVYALYFYYSEAVMGVCMYPNSPICILYLEKVLKNKNDTCDSKLKRLKRKGDRKKERSESRK